MKNKLRVLLICYLALSGLILVQINFAGAQETTLKDILKFDSSVPITSGDVIQDDSNAITVEGKEKTKSDDVLKEAEKIVQKSEDVYLTEGWLHTSSVTESFAPDSTTLPDGSPTPTKWTNELWVLLDDKGNAIKAVSTQDTGNPIMFQVSVFEESIWTNITLGFSSEPEIYRPALDSGFFSSVAPYKNSLALDQYSEILNGQNVVVFVSTEKYNEPIKVAEGEKTKEITAMVHKYYFSLDTGLPLQVEDYVANLDGDMELLQRISDILVEKIDNPPDLITNYFNK